MAYFIWVSGPFLPVTDTTGEAGEIDRGGEKNSGPLSYENTIISTPELSRAVARDLYEPRRALGCDETALQIRHHRLSRKASSFGEGRHLFGAPETRPARFQKASRTSRFI